MKTEATETHQKTELYKRWNVGHTQKNGWEPKDLTISARFEEGKEPTSERMTALARTAIEEARTACDELNAQDAEYAKFTGKAA